MGAVESGAGLGAGTEGGITMGFDFRTEAVERVFGEEEQRIAVERGRAEEGGAGLHLVAGNDDGFAAFLR